MAGTESREREVVKGAYPGDKWQLRVRNMSDKQVTAVFFRLKRANKI